MNGPRIRVVQSALTDADVAGNLAKARVIIAASRGVRRPRTARGSPWRQAFAKRSST
ncbi:hypothetical protein [Burkholderia sp. Ac-20353]|uniref:hypothetical protein n=1 Tax=Burkholderia sp. Ac-20353 TaxID=2703894 RepID=UPI00197CABFF|nr:hypothetical protein [Burkholderia sp. Ac-20353]MBN3792059.1 hypothetical protein [Burkholderia sp. Ac-20353]